MEAVLAMCSLDIIIQSNPDAQTLTLTPPRKKRTVSEISWLCSIVCKTLFKPLSLQYIGALQKSVLRFRRGYCTSCNGTQPLSKMGENVLG